MIGEVHDSVPIRGCIVVNLQCILREGVDNRDPEIAGEAFFSVFTFVSELQIGLWSSAYFCLPDDLVEPLYAAMQLIWRIVDS